MMVQRSSPRSGYSHASLFAPDIDEFTFVKYKTHLLILDAKYGKESPDLQSEYSVVLMDLAILCVSE
jgi:hypothetical protein